LYLPRAEVSGRIIIGDTTINTEITKNIIKVGSKENPGTILLGTTEGLKSIDEIYLKKNYLTDNDTYVIIDWDEDGNVEEGETYYQMEV
jgi:hypothetical protein